MGLHGVYGLWNSRTDFEFTTKSLEDYSALFVNVSGTTDSAFVEVLGRDDKPVAVAPVRNGVAEFNYLAPGDYYMRLFIDRNHNGIYDTGTITDSISQPEEVYYYPKKIVLKKNWDVEQSWDIYETAIDLQKPAEIKKNKPKDNKKRRRRPDGSYIDERDENSDEYDDEFDDGYGEMDQFGPGSYNGGRNIGNSRNNSVGGFSRNNRF